LEIAANGAVDLAAPARDAHVLSRAVRRIPALKIDRDYLRVYGEVRKFARVGREVRVRVEIREAVQ
jgi:ATP-dependent Lhr-like helicase